jgi:hypothetical protein
MMPSGKKFLQKKGLRFLGFIISIIISAQLTLAHASTPDQFYQNIEKVYLRVPIFSTNVPKFERSGIHQDLADSLRTTFERMIAFRKDVKVPISSDQLESIASVSKSHSLRSLYIDAHVQIKKVTTDDYVVVITWVIQRSPPIPKCQVISIADSQCGLVTQAWSTLIVRKVDQIDSAIELMDVMGSREMQRTVSIITQRINSLQ